MNAIMYYVVGLPLGVVLAFVVRMRIVGMCSEEKPGGAWRSLDAPPLSPVSYRPLAGHAGLCPAGSRGLCGLHCPDELGASSRGGEPAAPGLVTLSPGQPGHTGPQQQRFVGRRGAVSASTPAPVIVLGAHTVPEQATHSPITKRNTHQTPAEPAQLLNAKGKALTPTSLNPHVPSVHDFGRGNK